MNENLKLLHSDTLQNQFSIQCKSLAITLEVKEGTGVRGLLGRGLSDGQQVGAVATQDGRHEAQEGLLDLQLQSVEALSAVELTLSDCVLHLHVFTV